MPENDEVVEVYVSELNLLMSLVEQAAKGETRVFEAIQELTGILLASTKATASREQAFKAAVEGLTITNVVNVPEQPTPNITITAIPSEVIIQNPPEHKKRVAVNFSRDTQGRINGATGTIE